MEAPARSEAMTTTHDQARDGVPVGCFAAAPNFLFIALLVFFPCGCPALV
ncbi:hypothetical protein CCACVL1_25192 [Corchorus capsularis]|uniref:Uncharacterized protein n=1 Tax=Corchorus capsularis TaxID=210143 RepID=A0A1R3GLL4_COCAP|nr:hypothetical protein CCACVL1_25192 [Corchorus capsularis]